jgi:hypothetical protein
MAVLFLCMVSIGFIFMTMRRFIAKKRETAPTGGRLARWIQRLRSAEWRRYGLVLFAGKFAGLAVVAGAIYYFNPGLFGHKVFAADAVLKGNDIVNPVNTAWTLVAAFLVFGMQVGFTMLEAGFCRSRETVNVLMECIVDTCLCGLLFYAMGFSFMFSHGNGFIGYHWFFLQGAAATYETTGVAFLALLDLPVRVRRHLLNHYVGRHDRPHRLRSATCSTASAFRASSTPSSATGPGGRMASSLHGQPPASSCRTARHELP